MMIPGERISAEQAGGRPAEPGGHKLLCPKCEEFRMHKASPDPDGAIRLECYTCHTSDRFVMRAGLYVYEPFDKSLGAWVDEYADEVMTRKEEAAEPTARRAIFKRKIPKEIASAIDAAVERGEREAPPKLEPIETPKEDPFAGFDWTLVKTFADALAVADGDYEIAADLLRRAKEARAK